jgi:phage tail-like protein
MPESNGHGESAPPVIDDAASGSGTAAESSVPETDAESSSRTAAADAPLEPEARTGAAEPASRSAVETEKGQPATPSVRGAGNDGEGEAAGRPVASGIAVAAADFAAAEAAAAATGIVQTRAAVRSPEQSVPAPLSESNGHGGNGRSGPALLHVDHVPSVMHAYPSEELSFLTRVRATRALRGLTLEVTLPPNVELLDTDQPRGVPGPTFVVSTSETLLRWRMDGAIAEGSDLLFGCTIEVPALEQLGPDPAGVSRHSMLLSRARTLPQVADDQIAYDESEWAAVEVRGRGRYLSHLPSVFERDSFMGRFLMAFESFWAPIEQQVASVDSYFDPGLMSLPMLHWLADKIDLEIDPDWDEDVQRRMMARGISLFRKRGTRDGLQELLEVYTGGEVTIVERRAENFRLGPLTRLGSAVALGAANQPHTFSVFLKLPPIRASRPEAAEQMRDQRRHRIAKLIDSERPAHVRYTLDIEES